jgi:predicted DCC family thiol-disulfide oxidoreductase YuxK
MSSPLLNVYFDGLCPLCSREIEVYRKKDLLKQIHFVDIMSPSFDAEAEGLDPKKVHDVFHVKTPDGRILTRVDAFAEIWKTLPGFGLLRWVAEQPTLRPALDLGYRVFAKVRPYLPRKKGDAVCETDACRR